MISEPKHAQHDLVNFTTRGNVSMSLDGVCAGLVGGVAYAMGFGPLLGWAWGSFGAATEWWRKALIALATLSGVAGFGWVVWALARRLGEDFQHW